MKADNRKYIERFRHHRNTQLQAQFIGHIQKEEGEELLRIAREEFEPNYRCCTHCPDDLYLLVQYIFTQADKEPEAVAGPALELSEEGTAHMTFPKQDPAGQTREPEKGPNPNKKHKRGKESKS